MTRPIRILGIDPGLRRTGWGMVEIAGNRLGFIACGSVSTRDDDALAARLLAIHDGLMRILEEFRPDEAAVEVTFVNKDAKATLKLGQARGVAMVVPAKAGLTVAEYAPNLVKKSIVGAGHGDKAQVRMMIGVLLPKADPSSDDAADALAIAVTHAHHRQSVILHAALQVAARCSVKVYLSAPAKRGTARSVVEGASAITLALASVLAPTGSLRSPPPPHAGEERDTIHDRQAQGRDRLLRRRFCDRRRQRRRLSGLLLGAHVAGIAERWAAGDVVDRDVCT
jgi:crossover junction endodeoxyribonuclease RuvC